MYYDALKRRVKAVGVAQERKRAAMAVLDTLDVKQHIAQIYHDLHDDIEVGAHTVYNLPGGRGSCKSSFVSLEIVNGIMQDHTGQSSAIVFRLVGATMRESVYSQISWAIDILGVSHLWSGRLSPMSYTYKPTGAQIIFRGLDDASKLKSIKPRRGTFKFIWFEEFSELPGPNFLRNVMQSVQRGGDGFTVFRSFNPPISRNNWANEFIREPDLRAVTLHTDYTMIPPDWLGEAFLYEAERLREVNPDAYQHEYMGIPIGSGGEVFPNLEIREITDEEMAGMGYIYNGLDFGFAVDPACFMRVAYDRKRDAVYFLDEIYQRGLGNTAIAALIKERKYNDGYVVCDSAEPKSIADMLSHGLHCKACYKAPGCVEYRVKWLQHRRIIIDPQRTPNAYREFVGYEYETDKDGNFIARLPDENNHSIDAVAYALNHLIFTRRVSA